MFFTNNETAELSEKYKENNVMYRMLENVTY